MRHSLLRLAIVLCGLLICIQSASAQNFVEGQHYWLEPAVFLGSTPPKDHPRGPQKAKGVVLWNDGYSGGIAWDKVPHIVQYFAEQGWDAYNLRRHSAFYSQKISPLVLLGIEKLKAMGYSRIVLMGQSAGAYASIEVGSYRAEITGLLALAPAGFGNSSCCSEWRQNDSYIRTFWDKYKDSKLRVAAGFFANDEWYEIKHPQVRGPYAEKRLIENGIPNFIVSEPKYAGMATHFGGLGWQFARRYGPCLEIFFDTGRRPSCEDTVPGTAATFNIRPIQIPLANGDGYTGQWQGTLTAGNFVVLTLPPLTNGAVLGTYQIGTGLDVDKPGTAVWTLLPQDGRLAAKDKDYEIRVYPERDGKLKLTYIANANPTEERDYALLTRVTARLKASCPGSRICDESDPATALQLGIKPLPVPARDQSAFTGQWQGAIATGRLAVLTIPPQADGRVTATYQLGQGNETQVPSDNTWRMRQQNGYLIRTSQSYQFRAYATNDGRLRITSTKRDDTAAKETDFAMLTRITAR